MALFLIKTRARMHGSQKINSDCDQTSELTVCSNIKTTDGEDALWSGILRDI